MTFKKAVTALITFLAVVTLTACGKKGADSQDNWKKFESKKSVTIGFDNTFVPMGFKDKNGKNVGFDIDLANAVFNEYGIKVKWQPINWDLKETELKNGKIDLIWNGYSKTRERARKVSFTKPYMKNDQVLVTKKSSGYDAFTANPKILKDIVKDNDASQYETFTQAFIDLKNDRINGLLIDRVYANYYLKQEKELDNYNIIKGKYASEDFSVGVRKSDKTLKKKVNQAFKKLYKNGKFQAISQKWFGQDVASNAIKR